MEGPNQPYTQPSRRTFGPIWVWGKDPSRHLYGVGNHPRNEWELSRPHAPYPEWDQGYTLQNPHHRVTPPLVKLMKRINLEPLLSARDEDDVQKVVRLRLHLVELI